jgi:hypothetical protein
VSRIILSGSNPVPPPPVPPPPGNVSLVQEEKTISKESEIQLKDFLRLKGEK